ncbi:MAG: hypothetical protein JG775_2516 [Defluviitaleaceae bacterium]|jgi:hypothetical protein|nr:hypothetical protein [Defluviitaleaceae bacterium]
MYEFLISIISLIVSIIAVWISYSTQKRNNEIQQRLVHIEEQREYDRKIKSRQANLHAELRKEERGYKLYLINSGESEARNIRVEINGKPLRYGVFETGQDGVGIYGSLPSYVSSNSEVSYFIWPSPECFPSFEIEVKWDDDYQKDRSYKSILTF